ncbi:hypothetical protein SLEP1_g6398 [Rubroshorea leprosula]|uniref:NAC domain-containing protein n=1 Tax=Rubroshorea leprosula TaxID=152421 RepID=A0AAV5I134_9ROSI|nr:hypothetical protein SLEP1_g6398 [Rubroshorea leprosula]
MEEKMSGTVSASKNNGESDVLLPGFRFHPTDEELLGFYLKRKVEKKPLRIDIIKHIDIYKHDPWDLPTEVSKPSTISEKEWYFFCRRGRKYKNSIRPNRVTGSGFWKATGIDKPIYSTGDSHDCIGLKKTLVYYRGSAGKGTKTDWMMHEFRLPTSIKKDNFQEAEVWTLCRIFKRDVSYRKYASDFQKSYSKRDTAASTSSNVVRCNFESSNGVRVKDIDMELVKDHFHSRNQMSAAATHQLAPFPVSFSLEESWDELRPVVEFALDPTVLYI